MHVTKYSSTPPFARRSSGQLNEIEREGGRLLKENGGELFFFLAMAENTRKERRSPDNREKMKKSAAAWLHDVCPCCDKRAGGTTGMYQTGTAFPLARVRV